MQGAVAVSSYNDWDPLKEVIVGIADGSVQSAYEPALAPFYDLDDPGRQSRGQPYPPEEVALAKEQLEAFSRRLEREGVRVQRPDPVEHGFPYSTPDFQVPLGHGQACPRDSLLVLGSTIVEVPMAMRSRFFEYRAYRSLIRRYFEAGANWIAVPRPLLDDSSYVAGYSWDGNRFKYQQAVPLRENDPLFDGACFLRLGQDVFWQPDIVSNTMGFEWLRRHFGAVFRFHKVEFTDRAPEHIDTTFVAIRPGVIMVNPQRPCLDGTLDLFRANDWQIVEGPPSVREGLPFAAREVSNWISLNFLSLDPYTVVAEAAEKPLHDVLRKLGCDVIPVEFDRVFAFGGGFHCCTLDVLRDGKLESYFPTLDQPA
jgi:glycine amidinotransferase